MVIFYLQVRRRRFFSAKNILSVGRKVWAQTIFVGGNILSSRPLLYIVVPLPRPLRGVVSGQHLQPHNKQTVSRICLVPKHHCYTHHLQVCWFVGFNFQPVWKYQPNLEIYGIFPQKGQKKQNLWNKTTWQKFSFISSNPTWPTFLQKAPPASSWRWCPNDASLKIFPGQ